MKQRKYRPYQFTHSNLASIYKNGGILELLRAVECKPIDIADDIFVISFCDFEEFDTTLLAINKVFGKDSVIPISDVEVRGVSIYRGRTTVYPYRNFKHYDSAKGILYCILNPQVSAHLENISDKKGVICTKLFTNILSNPDIYDAASVINAFTICTRKAITHNVEDLPLIAKNNYLIQKYSLTNETKS